MSLDVGRKIGGNAVVEKNPHLSLGSGCHCLAQQTVFGEFQYRNGMLPRHIWKTCEKLSERRSILNEVE